MDKIITGSAHAVYRKEYGGYWIARHPQLEDWAITADTRHEAISIMNWNIRDHNREVRDGR